MEGQTVEFSSNQYFMFLRFFKLFFLTIFYYPFCILADNESYLVRGLPFETDELKLSLAKNSEPIWVELTEKKSLSDLLEQTCGQLSPKVNRYFLDKMKSLNAINNDDFIIDSGLAVAVPFCTKVVKEEKVAVEKGDTISNILRKHTGVFGPNSIRRLIKSNWKDLPDNLTEREIKNIAERIIPGQEILLSYSSPQRQFTPCSSPVCSGLPPNEILKKFHSADYVRGIADNLVVNTKSTESTESTESESFEFPDTELSRTNEKASNVRLVKLVDLESLDDQGQCQKTDKTSPFEIEEFNQVLKRQIDILSSYGEQTEQTIVGIIDSGLDGFGGPFFKEHFFEINKREVNNLTGGKKNFDDDENNFIDDIRGINFEGDLDRIEPYVGAKDRIKNHGTQVASLIIGGIEHINQNPKEDFVKMIIVNFGRREGGMHNTFQLNSAIHYLNRRGAEVINMSLSAPFKISSINFLDNVLFITAAGNLGGNIQLLDRYPARMGGKTNTKHVITVGSYNKPNQKAKFSNHGSNVDVYAPGCNLLVMNNDGITQVEHGSSMSAAIVSFVSSVTNGLVPGKMSASQIKKRLIRSSDYVQFFGNETEALIFNPYKMISLYEDVIELKTTTGNVERKYGKLNNVDELRRACAEPEVQPQLDGIVKVTPNIIWRGTTHVRYLLNPSGRGQAVKLCKQDSNFMLLGFNKEDSDISIPIKEIQDIVVSSF